MLALRLPAEMEKRLDALAKRTGRTKSFYARRAIMEFIENLEDVLDAEEVLAASDGKTISLEELMSQMGITQADLDRTGTTISARPASHKRRKKVPDAAKAA
jgi:RHH-type transcriptional regulator, rel operon repressor / antitoxin RelB